MNEICVMMHLCLKMEAGVLTHLNVNESGWKADCCQDEHDFDLCASAWFVFFF